MKEFHCGAVVPGCMAVFHGESDDAILGQVAEHARDDHGLADVPAELVAQVRDNITEVAA
jgi:predicted small metal-binding protein